MGYLECCLESIDSFGMWQGKDASVQYKIVDVTEILNYNIKKSITVGNCHTYPTLRLISATNCCTARSEPKSKATERHLAPAVGRSWAMRSMASAAELGLRHAKIMSQPCRANERAVSKPMPQLAPVMSAKRPCKSFPCNICNAVLHESKRWRTWVIFSVGSSAANARRGSIFVRWFVSLLWNIKRLLSSS